jgi:hypothetical protein
LQATADYHVRGYEQGFGLSPLLIPPAALCAAVNINSLSSMINRYIRDTIVELDARLYDLGAAQWWLLDLGPCFIGC